ncbi:PH domain-containing protein [Bacillus spongiae]|uniref:PH domain-containing protein n=1 Tax=Bacillus spongiae TaxID=2683610 RepID=A0ABU8HJ09_9BACI
MISEPKRLHPMAAVSNFTQQLKGFILPLVFALFINGGNENSFWDFIPLIFIGAILFALLIAGVLKWFRFTYRIEEGELRIESGLFVKKKRYIPFERIQSLNFSEGILQRPLGLVKVKVETAGGSDLEAEAVLSAISTKDAEELQLIIRDAKRGKNIDVDDASIQSFVYKMTFRDLFLMALTSSGGLFVLGIFSGIFTQFTEFIPYEAIYEQVEGIVRSGVVFILFVVIFVLLVTWSLSVIGTFLVYGHFTVVKSGDEILISRGILEKKTLTIPLNRIQGIQVIENPIRQWLGFAALHLHSAGGSALDQESINIKLFPFIRKNKIAGLLKELIPSYKLDASLHRAPKRSIRRYMVRESFIVVIPVLVLSIVFFPLGFFSFVLFLLSAIWGYLKYRSAGWHIDNNQFTLQYRKMSKHTMIVLKNRIQSFDQTQSWFQRRNHLVSFALTIKSGAGPKVGKAFYMNEQDGEMIKKWVKPEREYN